MQCMICRSSRLTSALRVDGYQLHRCGECSHLFVSDRVETPMCCMRSLANLQNLKDEVEVLARKR